MLLFLLVWCMMLLLASCSTGKQLHNYHRDSVAVIIRDSIRIRDSIILVPVPEGSDKARLPDSDTSLLETSVAKSTAFIDKGGRICHTLTNKSDAIIPIKVTIPERLHIEEKGLTRYLKQVERVEVEKALSRWQRFLQGLGYSVLIAGALWLACKLSKIVRF